MRTLPKYLTQDEIRRFFNAIDSVRDRALFGVIYHYGLRVDEATPLTTDDIELKHHPPPKGTFQQYANMPLSWRVATLCNSLMSQ
jgi:integrase